MPLSVIFFMAVVIHLPHFTHTILTDYIYREKNMTIIIITTIIIMIITIANTLIRKLTGGHYKFIINKNIYTHTCLCVCVCSAMAK